MHVSDKRNPAVYQVLLSTATPLNIRDTTQQVTYVSMDLRASGSCAAYVMGWVSCYCPRLPHDMSPIFKFMSSWFTFCRRTGVRKFVQVIVLATSR